MSLSIVLLMGIMGINSFKKLLLIYHPISYLTALYFPVFVFYSLYQQTKYKVSDTKWRGLARRLLVNYQYPFTFKIEVFNVKNKGFKRDR